AYELVHVFDIVSIELVRVGAVLALGSAHNGAVDVRHGVIEEEGLVFVLCDELDDEVVHDVGQVLLFRQVLLLAIDSVLLSLGAPVAAAAGENEVLIETPFAGAQADLTPLADTGRHISCLLHDGWDHDLSTWLDGIVALVVDQAGAEGITTGQ